MEEAQTKATKLPGSKTFSWRKDSKDYKGDRKESKKDGGAGKGDRKKQPPLG